MKNKKLIIILAAVFWLISVIPAGASFSEMLPGRFCTSEVIERGTFNLQHDYQYENERQVRQALLEGILNREEYIDISAYEFYDEDMLNVIFSDLLNTEPRAFALESQYSWWWDTDYISEVDLSYSMTKAEYDERINMIEHEEQKIFALMESRMSEAEKFLLIHDYIVSNFDYDTNYTNYDIDVFVEQRVGVCEAYSKFFMDVARNCGLECELVPSEAMCHEWNRVKIGNNWYHVDATYDDPTTPNGGGLAGRAKHDYFLLDDTTISGGTYSHYDWDTTEFTANDSSYVGRKWVDITSPFVYANGDWYTVGYSQISTNGRVRYTYIHVYEYDFEDDVLKTMYRYPQNTKRWLVFNSSTGGFYTGTYNGAFLYHGYMVFNLLDGIYTFDPTNPTNAPQMRYTCDISQGYVSGCRMRGTNLEYFTADQPNNGMGSSGYHTYTVDMENVVPAYDGISYINMNAKCEANKASGDITVYNFEDCRVNDFYVAVYDSNHRVIYADVRPGESMAENYPYTYTLNANVSGGAYIKAFVFKNTTMDPVLKAEEVSFVN